MDEKEAIELLIKLNDFMTNTTKQITTLINEVHNMQVEIDALKKTNKTKIILPN